MPRYKHYCENCTYLGVSADYDLYFCTQGGMPGMETVVARYGDKGADYTSGICFAAVNPHIYRAVELAVQCGKLKADRLPAKAPWADSLRLQGHTLLSHERTALAFFIEQTDVERQRLYFLAYNDSRSSGPYLRALRWAMDL